MEVFQEAAVYREHNLGALSAQTAPVLNFPVYSPNIPTVPVIMLQNTRGWETPSSEIFYEHA